MQERFFTLADTASILMGVKYSHARMFCALAHMSSIPMVAINFYMQERFYTCWYHLMFAIYLHARMFCTLAPYIFYSHGCNVRVWNLFWASVAKPVQWQLMILLLCTLPHMSSIPMGCNKFLHSRTFFTLADTTSIQMLVSLLFPWVQCQSLKPVLSQFSQTSFVAVDDFIAMYTRSYVFYSHGCNKFLHARAIFTLAHTITPIFTVLTIVWPVLIEPWSQIIRPC